MGVVDVQNLYQKRSHSNPHCFKFLSRVPLGTNKPGDIFHSMGDWTSFLWYCTTQNTLEGSRHMHTKIVLNSYY